MGIRLGNPNIVTDRLICALDASSSMNYLLSEVEVLVVAGGGGGAGGWGNGGGAGGGGAGGVLHTSSYPVTPGSGITVTVGNGGNGGTGSTQAGRSNNAGQPGQDSIFGNLVAIGGGGGANFNLVRITGGSGAGGGYSGSYLGGTGTPGQGNAGGSHSNQSLAGYSDPFTNNYAGGGGGGAGTPGERGTAVRFNNYSFNISSQRGGKGGDGILCSISGRPRWYGGGGGGSTYAGGIGGLGGLGGGGKGGSGGVAPGEVGTSGVNGTGGGGGAGGEPGSGTNVGGNGGNGGSGIVIVRYPGPQKATGGNTIQTLGGYTIHTFTGPGTFTPLSAPTNGSTVYGLADLSGNGHALRSAGSPPTYSTVGGGSVQFGLNSSSSLYTPQPSKLLEFPYGDFTCEFWINIGTGGDATNIYYNILNIGNTFGYGSSQLYWNIWRSGIFPGALYQRINDVVSLGYGSYSLNGPVYKLSGAGWVYVATRETGGTISWTIRGGVTGSESRSTPSYPSPAAGGSYINLGKAQSAGEGSFQGYFSELRIYKKYLSDGEIDQNYNATKGRYGY